MGKKKQESKSPAYELRDLLETNRVVIGTDRVMKQLKLGRILKIFLTVNCPEELKAKIAKYANIAKAELIQLQLPNDELGVVCKKPFSISIAGILKE